MSPETHDYGRFDELAEEFAERYRRGERPSLEEYVGRLPEMADQIRDMFPALVEVEKVEGDARDQLFEAPSAILRLQQVGDFRIVRKVGSGGMGVVYEAEQVSLGRRVALKILPGHVAGDRKALQRFRREAKAAARLHHTNIVPVFEIGVDGDVAYYAMQFIQGQGLDQVIDELRRFRAPDAKPADSDELRAGSERSGRSQTARTVSVARPREAGPHNRTLGQFAESLLSGRLESRALESSAVAACVATLADGTKPIEAAVTEGAGASNKSSQISEKSAIDEVSSSAVLPGGTAVSTVGSSARRPFFRSVAQIGRQVAQGLSYAHARGIIHRDIKPSNLLLDTAGVVWITDFGLAKGEEDGLTATGDILGTLCYMAPERFRGEGDARADIYALGLTLYELLTLRPAFDTPDRLKLIELIKAEEPSRPRSLDGRIPRDLETILLKAIDKDPKRRYATAEAMAEDLRRFLADEPIQARQTSVGERYWRWARRNPTIAALGGVLTAVLVVATVASLVVATRMTMLAEKERFAGLAERSSRHAADQARDAAKQAHNVAARQSAGLLLDRGIEDARAGEPARALHLFVRALQALPPDDAASAALERVIRMNLSTWAETVPVPEHVWPPAPDSTPVAFSPDGARIAMAIGDDEIQCFRTDSGLPSGPPVKLPDKVGRVMLFAPDGRSLWVTSPWQGGFPDKKWLIHRFDPESGRPVQPPIPSPGPVLHLNVTPDGRYLVGTVDGLHPLDHGPSNDAFGSRKWRTASIVVWDAATGQIARKVDVNADYWATYTGLSPDAKSVTTWITRESKCFEGITFSLDGKEAPISLGLHPSGPRVPFALEFQRDMGTALVVKDGQIHRWFATKPGVLDSGVPTPFQFMLDDPPPDGRTVISRNDYRVFDTGTWPPRATGVRFAHPGWRYGLAEFNWAAYSADGRFLATWIATGENERRLWRMPRPHSRPPAPAAEFAHPPERTDYYSCAEIDGQAMRAVLWWRRHGESLGNDTQNVRIVDLATHDVRDAVARDSKVVRDVSFTPDGRYFASAGSDATARVWDAATGRAAGPVLRHTNWVAAVAFSPDGNTLAAGDFGPAGLIKLWDWRTGKEVRPPLQHDDIVLDVGYSPDAKYLAAVKTGDWSNKPELLVWDVATGKPVIKVPHRYPQERIARQCRFSPDGRAIAARDKNGVLRLFEVPSGKVLGERPFDSAGVTRFSPDGRVIAAAANLGVRLLDGRSLAALPAGYLAHPDPISDLAFSPNGELLLTAHETGSAQLWDVGTGKPVGPPAVLIGPIRAVSFTPDGKTCLCVAGDGTVRRWPVGAPFSEPDLVRLANRVNLMTGQRMDNDQGVDYLPTAEWKSLREKLVGEASTALVALRPDADWHDTVAADAEQDGDAFGAVWHLDRLAALRPKDWTILARRGRVLARAGRREEAALAYAASRSLAPTPGVLADWLRAAAADDEAAKRFSEGMWCLDRAVEINPDDWCLYAARAALVEKAGHPDKSTADVDAALRLGADASVLTLMSERAAARATTTTAWSRVASILRAASQDPSATIDDLYHLAAACMKAGDRTGYRAACAQILQRMPATGAPLFMGEAIAATSAFAIGSNASDDWSVPLSWADRILRLLNEREAANPSLKEGLKKWRRAFLYAQGTLFYRAGRPADAVKSLREGITLHGSGEFADWLFLALAEHALGRKEAAKEAAARARAVRPAAISGSPWDRAEAELLGAKLDAILPPPPGK